MIGALAKCGDVNGAVEVFNLMLERDAVSWTSLIGALATQGKGHEAVLAFDAMCHAGVQPDEVTFIGVLSACSHAGLVDEGRRYFDSMWIEFGIRPKIEHYGCMVDLFSRAGLVDQVVDFICSIPMKPNAIIWRTLINACRVHGRLELVASITNRLLKDDPSQGSNYVMLSNVYSLTQQWEKKFDMWKAMGTRGLLKEPGSSSLDVNGEIHELIAGNESKSTIETI
jgi:pentatricopeptide repeat protein